jgi:hypothetical protein
MTNNNNSDIHNIKISEFLNIQEILFPERSVIIFGSHGIGKSAIVYELAKDRGLPVIERRLSQITDDLILGIPYLRKDQDNDDRVTKMTLFNWIKQACDEPVVLFLDEVDRASLEVQQAVFQLAGSRRLWDKELHPETCIICTGNGHPDVMDRYPGVKELGAALLDRFWVGYIDPTIGEWIEWAESHEIHPLVISFIKENPDLLEVKNEEYMENVVYQTRRSWSWFSNHLYDLEKIGKEDQIALLSSGYISMDTGMSFQAYYHDNKQIKIADVIACNEKAKEINDLAMGQAVDIVNRMTSSDSWKDLSATKQVKVIKFLAENIKSDTVKDAVFKGFVSLNAKVIMKTMKSSQELMRYFKDIEGFEV